MSKTLKTLKLPYSSTSICIEMQNNVVIGKFVESNTHIEFYNQLISEQEHDPMAMLHDLWQTLDIVLPLLYNRAIELVEISFCGSTIVIMRGYNNGEEAIGMTIYDECNTLLIGEYSMNTDPKVILGLWKALFTQEALTA